MSTAAAATTAPPGAAPSTTAAVSRRTRIVVALAIGAFSALFCYLFQRLGPRPDFLYWWSAARMVLAGQDPYALMPAYNHALQPPFDAPFFYPLPAVLLVTPLARIPMQLASVLGFGAMSGLLAFLVTRESLWRLAIFANASFFLAAACTQWSPLIVAAALAPGLAVFLWCKPTLGLAALAWNRSWKGIALAAALGVASLFVIPDWPREWLRNTSLIIKHPAPIMTPAGPLALLALLRWRNREARVFLVMACVPQLLFFYDQLPLWLLPRTPRQSLWLSLASALGAAGWAATLHKGEPWVLAAAPWVLALVYLPALVIVLLQPHDGPTPAWLHRLPVFRRLAHPPTPPA